MNEYMEQAIMELDHLEYLRGTNAIDESDYEKQRIAVLSLLIKQHSDRVIRLMKPKEGKTQWD